MEIAEHIHENEFSGVDSSGFLILSNAASRCSRNFSEFIETLRANICARTFELGINSSVDISMEFGYDREAKLSYGMLHYNDIPVIQPLACVVGIYTYCVKYVLNPNIFCPSDYQGLKNEILNDGIPTDNY